MKTRHLLLVVMLSALLILSFAAPAAAGAGKVVAGEGMPVALNQAQGPTDAAELEEFMDDLLPRQAVMQLTEQGKLGLNADVNAYFDFRLPDTYPQPITLKHLRTHTSGIEDRWLESLVTDPGELVSEREWLIDNFPGQSAFFLFLILRLVLGLA